MTKEVIRSLLVASYSSTFCVRYSFYKLCVTVMAVDRSSLRILLFSKFVVARKIYKMCVTIDNVA